MKGQSILFSKGKDDWRTPRALFDALDAEFHFTCDVAADATSKLCEDWLGPGSPYGEDALTARWGSVNWCNPPYSMVKKFVTKAAEENAGAWIDRKITVMLIPARTDTKMFHDHIWDRENHCFQPRRYIRFLKGRVKFVDPSGEGLRKGHTPNSAPFPSMIVVFG